MQHRAVAHCKFAPSIAGVDNAVDLALRAGDSSTVDDGKGVCFYMENSFMTVANLLPLKC